MPNGEYHFCIIILLGCILIAQTKTPQLTMHAADAAASEAINTDPLIGRSCNWNIPDIATASAPDQVHARATATRTTLTA